MQIYQSRFLIEARRDVGLKSHEVVQFLQLVFPLSDEACEKLAANEQLIRLLIEVRNCFLLDGSMPFGRRATTPKSLPSFSGIVSIVPLRSALRETWELKQSTQSLVNYSSKIVT